MLLGPCLFEIGQSGLVSWWAQPLNSFAICWSSDMATSIFLLMKGVPVHEISLPDIRALYAKEQEKPRLQVVIWVREAWVNGEDRGRQG